MHCGGIERIAVMQMTGKPPRRLPLVDHGDEIPRNAQTVLQVLVAGAVSLHPGDDLIQGVFFLGADGTGVKKPLILIFQIFIIGGTHKHLLVKTIKFKGSRLKSLKGQESNPLFAHFAA